MDPWDEAVSNHPFHSSLRALREMLDKSFVHSSDVSLSTFERADRVCAYLEDWSATTEPAFLSLSRLEKLKQYVEGVRTQLEMYSQNHSEVHLQKVHNNLDAALDVASRTPVISNTEDAHRLIEYFSDSRQRVAKFVTGAQESLQDLSTKADVVSKSLDESKLVLEQQKGRLDTVIGELQSQFSEAEDRRRKAFEDHLAKLAAAGEEAAAEDRKRVDETIAGLDDKIGDILKELGEKRDEALRLVRVIGNIGVTGNFKEVADSERRAADRFRIVAIIFMLAIVVGVVATIWSALAADAVWHDVATRLGIVLALAVPATYTARESSGHRRVERATRRLELELSSLDPYLESLPNPQRHEIKQQLSEKFFGSVSRIDSKEEAPVSRQSDVFKSAADGIADFLKRLADQLSKQ